MKLHFNVTGESRKAMVKAIEKELGEKSKYLGMPSAAYQIGIYTIEKDGTLVFPLHTVASGVEEEARVIDACVMATGVSPIEWDNNETGAEKADSEAYTGADEGIELTVRIPLEKASEENLKSLLKAKSNLIKKALGIECLNFLIDGNEVQFPWFKNIMPEEAMTYTKFIAAICEMSIKQKKITAKEKENENEKYAFRCFLLRLGFIGDEFKNDRKILLKNLEGSSAFKSGKAGN